MNYVDGEGEMVKLITFIMLQRIDNVSDLDNWIELDFLHWFELGA